VVTKLQKAGHGYDECLEAFNSSLNKLDVNYVDLYLIHHPKPGRNIESYKAMMKLKEQGRIKYVTLQCTCSFAFVVSCFCFEGFSLDSLC